MLEVKRPVSDGTYFRYFIIKTERWCLLKKKKEHMVNDWHRGTSKMTSPDYGGPRL